MKHFLVVSFLFSFLISNHLFPQQASNFQGYSFPRISPKSKDYKLKVNGVEVLVYHTTAAPFATFTVKGEVEIEIEIPKTDKKISISPKRYKIEPTVNGNKVSFKIPGAMNVVLEFEGMPQLFIYANAPATNIPDANASNVKYFKAGQVYEIGLLELHDNETLFIEGGAVVRGCIKATSAKNVRIAGNGVLDASYFTRGIDGRRSIVLEDCKNSVIEDIIMIEPQSWMIVLGISENITVRNVKELGFYSGTDGIDIVGCKHIKVENCIFRNGDDCAVIKSLPLKRDATLDYSKDVEDIEVTGCTFVAYEGGTVLEIGHELRTASIKNIRFTNIDVLGVHLFGGVFGIHNADRAVVSDVLYENIRVEHHYNKLIDIKVIKSMWGKDEERGQIRNVTFRNIDVDLTIYNSGYSMSLLGGYDAKHTVENVVFDNFRVQGVKITNGDDLSLFTKQTKGVVFK
ncbi:MAG: glycosyl hydrolase family 28 protein [Bacteroidota bacterium]|nr:glycosyl hydrolase family 28 protein [Bacteroidota bacterium]